jgi:hypothetical protein
MCQPTIVLCECFLEPSRYPYTVLISTYDKGQEAKFLLRVSTHLSALLFVVLAYDAQRRHK